MKLSQCLLGHHLLSGLPVAIWYAGWSKSSAELEMVRVHDDSRVRKAARSTVECSQSVQMTSQAIRASGHREFGYSFLSRPVWYSRCYVVLPVQISCSLWEHVFISILYSRAGFFNLLSSRANLYFHIILRATVIADYKINMDILNIIIGEWAAHQVT